MAIAVRSEKLRELVDENAAVEQVATGFTFTEGPIWMDDGSLHFSDMPGDKRRRWHPEEGVQVLRDPSNKCNGMTRDNDGNLIVCEHVTSSVVRERLTGAATSWPSTGRQGPEQPERRRRRVGRVDHLHRPDLRPHARLRHRARAGAGLPGRLSDPAGRRAAAPRRRLRPAERALLLAGRVAALHQRHRQAHIRVFDVGPRATLSNGRVFAESIGDGDLAKGGLVDGMKLDERGNVYVTGPEGVWVFSPEGEHLGVIGVPESVGNVNWGDDDWRSLFIPASTSVYRVRMKVGGNRLGYMN